LLTPPEVAARVRQNAGSAFIAALCLNYFGYFHFAIPAVINTFTLGDAIFNYTLRIGGVIMAATLVASLTGKRWVLAIDGVASIAIGVALGLSALIMMLGGGLGINQLIYVFASGMFISAGLRNARDYRDLRPTLLSDESNEFQNVLFEPARAQQPVQQAVHQSPSKAATKTPPPERRNLLLTRSLKGSAGAVPEQDLGMKPKTSPVPATEVPNAAPSPPPPDGYLASFAKKKPPPAS